MRRVRLLATTARLATAFLLAGLVAACSGAGSASPSGPAATAAPVSPMVGVVTSLDSHGLSDVRGFTLRADDGRAFTFTIGQLENGAAFPPGHLAEHMATAEKVRVSFRVAVGKLVVYRLEDAGSGAPPTTPAS